MTQTITRMFNTPERAAEAEAALRADGFSPNQIRLVLYPGRRTAGTNRIDPTVESLTQEIAAGHVLQAHARIYAQGVMNGGSLVTIHAPFGTAARAMAILSSFHPIGTGIEEPEIRVSPWDEAAPISSALRIPLFLDMSAPFSTFWNLPVLLMKSASVSASLGLPLLVRQTASLSASLGLPLLVSRFNLSAALGLPTLIRARLRRT